MNNKLSTFALVVALAALGLVLVRPAGNSVSEGKKETAFERVMRTNTLRCGYGIWAPGLIKDAKTGELSGIFHDYLEAVAKHAGLKIEWAEEVPWGDYPAALNSGRIDAMCFGAWPKATTARETLFTKPVYYLPINAYVRAGDSRFDRAVEKINSPDVQISAMDGEMSSQLAVAYFPQAKILSIPQLSDASMLLTNVANNKADVTFTDAWTGALFMKNNSGKLKVVPLDRPLRLFGHTIPVARGEQNLVSFLNTATDELFTTGELDAIIKKYEDMPGVLLHLPRPYEELAR
ncbi:MAG: transporter substrate-binding domain-containing protein [Alphaproteobacteria bacterium]|nr:transporter substrate-binding domain-containing protein [Alphaproteobacteria bacterium]